MHLDSPDVHAPEGFLPYLYTIFGARAPLVFLVSIDIRGERCGLLRSWLTFAKALFPHDKQ